MFLILRALVDLWTSMFFEVSLASIGVPPSLNLLVGPVAPGQPYLGLYTPLWYARYVPESGCRLDLWPDHPRSPITRACGDSC